MVAKLIPAIFQRPTHYHITQYNLYIDSVMMLYVKVVSKLEFGAVFHKDAKRPWIYLRISECRGIW